MEFLTDPISWWIDPFTVGWMQRSLIAGLLVVISTSLVGTWVVLRGMSFFGDALAHGVLPGIVLAYVLGVNTTIGAIIAAGAMMGCVTLVKRHSPLPEETAIGVLFVGFLALAVVIVSSSAGADAGDLNRFLFGTILSLQNADVVRQGIAALLTIVGVAVFYRAFLVLTFSEAKAQLLGLHPKLANAVLLGLLGLTIVSSFQAVGNLLVFAFLVAPPAAGALVVKRVPLIMAASVGIGSVSVIVGLAISYNHGSAAEATMALVAVCLFFLTLAISVVFKTANNARSF